MKPLIYLLIGASFFSSFRDLINVLGPLGKLFTFVPEVLAALLLASVMLELGRRKQLALSPKYMLLAILLLSHVLIGIALNTVPAGTVAGGMRLYFKFMPVFLAPCVVPYSEREIQNLLKFILFLCLLQAPVALLQRVFVFSQQETGDVVRGTFGVGSILSITLVSIIVALVGFYQRNRLSKKQLALLAPTLFLPTMINETKGTIVLLPIAMFGLAMLNAKPGHAMKNLLLGSLLTLAFIGTFAAAYRVFFPGNLENDMGVLEFLFEGAAADAYYKDKGPGEGKTIGRWDSVVFAYDILLADPTRLLAGLGIGNVSDPSTSSIIRGAYSEEFFEYGVDITTISYLIWEVGLIGVAITFMMIGAIFWDAKALSRQDTLVGALGLAWAAILTMMPAAMLYKDLIHHAQIGFLAALVSGIIVSARYRQLATEKQRILYAVGTPLRSGGAGMDPNS
ncbi:MAG: hypothetical protein AAGI88_22195 [Pseudomonadota bacterium]